MMASLLTMSQVMVQLGRESDDDTYEETMPAVLESVTSWFEGYCDRGLASRIITGEETWCNYMRRIHTWAYPLVSLQKVVVDDVEIATSNYVINSKSGYFTTKRNGSRPLVEAADLIKVDYTGGYANNLVPSDLAQAFAVAVGLHMSIPGTVVPGTSASAIRSIGLGSGALSVAFDTGTKVGGITGSFDVSNIPPEVQQVASTLDRYLRMRV